MTRPIIAVFGSSASAPESAEWVNAAHLGRRLGEEGYDVANGGYGGTMEAVSRGAVEAGAHVIGVTAPAIFPDRTGANAYVTHERPARSLTERLHDLMSIASGAVTLPGSIGTLTELMVAWNEMYIRCISGRTVQPVVAIGEPWAHLIPHIADLLTTDASLVTLVSTVDHAVEHLNQSGLRGP